MKNLFKLTTLLVLAFSTLVASDLKELEQKAKNGDINAQYELGSIYYNGDKGILRDFVKAKEYYQMAANKGMAGAHVSLGLLYALGYGVPQDFVQASAHWNVAYALGETSTQSGLKDLASLMSAQQIQDSLDLAEEIFNKLPKN